MNRGVKRQTQKRKERAEEERERNGGAWLVAISHKAQDKYGRTCMARRMRTKEKEQEKESRAWENKFQAVFYLLPCRINKTVKELRVVLKKRRRNSKNDLYISISSGWAGAQVYIRNWAERRAKHLSGAAP